MKKQTIDFAEIKTKEELALVSGGGSYVLTVYKCASGDYHHKQDPKSSAGGNDGSL